LSAPLAIFLIRTLPKYIELQNKLSRKPLKITYAPNRLIYKYISQVTYVISIAIPLVISHFFTLNPQSFLLMFFCWIVLILIAIDFCTLYLPDILTLPMIWLGLIKEFFVSTQFIGMNRAVTGAVLSYVFLRVISEIYYLVAKKEPLGRGDIKFFAMIGAWLGIEATFFTIMLSSILICIWFAFQLIFFKSKSHKKYFAYGPWIGLGVYIYLILSH
jgi:prepilin signal peptidase PulO-like enzyme (type II secretory pathway)